MNYQQLDTQPHASRVIETPYAAKVRRAVDMYVNQASMTVYEVAREVGLKSNALKEALAKRGIELRNGSERGLSSRKVALMKKAFAEGMTYSEISRAHGVDRTRVMRIVDPVKGRARVEYMHRWWKEKQAGTRVRRTKQQENDHG